MESQHWQWEWVDRRARALLSRCLDPTTRDLRDDIVQEASLHLWQFAERLDDRNRIGAALRTIVRRRRYQAIAERRRRGWLKFGVFGSAELDEPSVAEPDEPRLAIAGRSVPLDWAKSRLAGVMARLPALDRQLLLGFHEGFCCAELASRFGRSEACVKTRLHRARRRVRSAFECLVRLADHFGDPQLEVEG